MTFPGRRGLERTRFLLKQLGDPQEQLRVIHVAGTSGKGSTATLIAHLLYAHGFKVGLHLSPYVYDIRERVQLNGQLIDHQKFVTYLNELMPAIEATSHSEYGAPTYFEILVALAYYTFAREQVDYAVMEVGLGGTFDGTNVVNRPDKVCVITPIDVDHRRLLGDTPAENAIQKAGIIQPGNHVVARTQLPEVTVELNRRIRQVSASVEWIDPDQIIRDLSVTLSGTIYRQSIRDREFIDLRLKLIGRHQAENAAHALTVVTHIADRDHWSTNEQAIRHALVTTQLPGRFEIVTINGRTCILDLAHNPQKIASVVATVQSVLPGTRIPVLVAFRDGKDSRSCIRLLQPIASQIVGTTFGTSSLKAISIGVLQAEFGDELSIPWSVVTDPIEAFQALISQSDGRILVTGSTYLIEAIRQRTERV